VTENGIRGVIGTPVTPFGTDGQIDYETTERLIEFLIESGVHGIALPMHIGESLNLTSAERRQLAEVALKTVAGRVPVTVNTSVAGTDEVIELSRHAQELGAAAVVVTAPYHWGPPPEALKDHFLAVGRSIDIGLFAYNYPAKFGVSVSTPIVEALIEGLPNFMGVKDASLNMEYFTELCRIGEQLRPGFAVFTGVEYLLPSMVLGGAGTYSALGAVAPKLVQDLYAASRAGDLEAALPLQRRASELWTLLQAGYPATIKAAMAIMGRPGGGTRRPLPSLTEDQTEAVRRRLAATGVLEDEVHGWQVASAARA